MKDFICINKYSYKGTIMLSLTENFNLFAVAFMWHIALDSQDQERTPVCAKYNRYEGLNM